tara:strand:+ start:954 stop:3377 length:2424 start_codon:yes stop_codon:yes gene_type:complete
MLIPLSWLENYTNVSLPAKDIAHKLTMAGTEISSIDEIGKDWDDLKIFVGEVIEVNPHPNADRLRLPKVNLGNDEIVTVVCGAPNVTPGQKIAFAKEGALIISNKTGKLESLKAATIRGIESSGMVCSESELGLGENHAGILVLDDSAEAGQPLSSFLGDTILDAEVTPNRPDCLSILGVARELAAITGTKVLEPETILTDTNKSIEPPFSVEIEDNSLCKRYTARYIEGLKVRESPQWLQDALIKSGQRPINNIVDITNYVMLEYGQPLHAFDYDTVEDSIIKVRQAHDGEQLAGLDGLNHHLRPPMLVIADSSGPIALAGIVGGTKTSVSDRTSKIILESANFDAFNTRLTRVAIGEGTESSYRFERGIQPELAIKALDRATNLIIKIAGGKTYSNSIDHYPEVVDPTVIHIKNQRIFQVLGTNLPQNQVINVLDSLGFEIVEQLSDGLKITPPYWRSDVSIEEDVIEEIARIIGYDSIPVTTISAPMPSIRPKDFKDFREGVRDKLTSLGMQEIITYSLTNLDTLNIVDTINKDPLKIEHPMSIDLEVLRTSLRGGVLKALEYNQNVNRNEGFRFFEIGKIFIPNNTEHKNDLPNEKEFLVGILSGPRSTVSWLEHDENDMDFYDAKGILESLFLKLNLDVSFNPTNENIIHPGKAAQMSAGGTNIGILGELHPRIIEYFQIENPKATLFEIDLLKLFEIHDKQIDSYNAINRFPEAERDIAVIVDEQIPSLEIQKIIDRHKLVKSSTPFDIYTGKGVSSGKKSIAFKVKFQSDINTLTSDDIDKAYGDIIRQLNRNLKAELRS